jgi:hypothetical protein
VRTDPDFTAGERDSLVQYLDKQRETLLLKTDGLTREQLGQRLPTSELTLAGLLYHAALNEEAWIEMRFAGLDQREPWASVDWDADPDWEFHTALQLEPEELRQRYREASERSNLITAQAGSLDQLATVRLDGQAFTLRWVLLHLIEETARHAGHADLLREAIDGEVGE